MDRNLIEQQIEELLSVEMNATLFSQLMFSPTGLFHDLAGFEGDHKAVTRLPLYRQAMARFRELQNKESAGMQREVDLVNAALARGKARAALTSANGSPSTGAVVKVGQDEPA